MNDSLSKLIEIAFLVLIISMVWMVVSIGGGFSSNRSDFFFERGKEQLITNCNLTNQILLKNGHTDLLDCTLLRDTIKAVGITN